MKLDFQKLLSRLLVISMTVSLSPGGWVKADSQEDSNQNRKPSSKESAIKGIVAGQAQGIFNQLNAAMANAAVNPMDEWRREQLQKAYSAVPSAVNGVASTFFSNAIGTSSLPMVQQMMGAMIDQGAPNSYDKFLQDPNHQLVPDLGMNSPVEDRGQGMGYTVATPPEKSKEITEGQAVFSPVKNSSIMESSLVTKAVPKDTALLDQVSSFFTGPRLGSFNETTEAEKRKVERETKNNFFQISNTSSTQTSSEESSTIVSVLQQDIQSVENNLKTASQSQQEELAMEEIASKKKVKQRASRREKSFKLRKPTSWLLQPLFFLGESVFEKEALAQGANDQQESGGGGGQILSRFAQMIAAAAPMVVAGIESGKEQAVARINTEAQITQTKIQADTQMSLAQQSSQASMAQAQMSKDVAQMNNDEQTKRLMINLQAAQQVRDEERTLQAEKDKIQQQLEAQKIALAQKQADDAIRLAEQKLEEQKLAATLTGQPVPSSSGSSAGSTYSANPLMSALGSNQGTTSTGRGFMGAQSSSEEDKPSNRLLASVDSSLNKLEESSTVQRWLGKTRPKASSGTRALKNGNGVYPYSSAVKGTFSSRAGDLSQFAQESKQPAFQSFADYQNHQSQRASRSFLSH